MRGCLLLLCWSLLSLMTVGGLLQYEDHVYSNYPGAPKPTVLPTREELAVYTVFGMFWLAGVALVTTLGWIWRTARDDAETGGRSAILVALVWGLLISWITAGSTPLFFPVPAHDLDVRLLTWDIDSSVELVFLPSFAILLWSGGLGMMLLAVRSIWRWLPAE